MATVDPHLGALAEAHGVMTSYADWSGKRVDVPTETVHAVLRALGVDTTSDEAVAHALDIAEVREWSRLCPPTVVLTPEARTCSVHVPAGAAVLGRVHLEGGGAVTATFSGPVDVREVNGQVYERWRLHVPATLALGYHRLLIRAGEHVSKSLLVFAPTACPTAESLGPVWGWMVQLYAVRSKHSWGIGDYADLADLCQWSGAVGADFVLCNPLHATSPTMPQVDSPYSPASRRFHSTLYLRPEIIPEADLLDPAGHQRLQRLAAAGRALCSHPTIDRDAVARLQREAMELLRAVPLAPWRANAFREFQDREGSDLVDFATWCALSETYGPRWTDWPSELRHPRSPAVAARRHELAELVDLHVWLQWHCDEQLAAAQRAAQTAGQRIGVVHDLAVGVGPSGADGWALQDDLALDMSIGAPPDSFNQRGQDWQLPPLRPDRLGETGYAAFRQMLRSVMRHGGGIRIDHAMGLFRLFWVPTGCSPAAGTYVRYPAADLLGILALEADRAGAIVVAEDLGTVEDGVPEQLAERGIYGSAVLWFEHHDDGSFISPADYRAGTFASITTHDLPTAAGFWQGEATAVRAELGLLGEGRSVADQEDEDLRQRAALRHRLLAEGLARDEADEGELVVAMHELLARSASALVGVALGDAVGEHRQPNMPGTLNEYPNWRLPLSDTSGLRPVPVELEDLAGHPGVRRVVELLSRIRPRAQSADRSR